MGILKEAVSIMLLSLGFLMAPAFCHAPNYLEAGETSLKLHQYEHAAGYFKAELAYHQNSPAGHFGLAKAYFLLGKPLDAVRELEKTSAMDPSGDIGNQARKALAARKTALAKRSSQGPSVSNASSLKAVSTSPDTRVSSTPALSPLQMDLVSCLSYMSVVSPRPLISQHMNAAQKALVREAQVEYDSKVHACKKAYGEAVRNVGIRQRNSSEGSPDWLFCQSRIEELKAGEQCDILDAEQEYLRKCKDVYNQAEAPYMKRAAAAVSSASSMQFTAPSSNSERKREDAFRTETQKRLHQLADQRNKEVHALSAEWKEASRTMRVDRDLKSKAAPVEDAGRVASQITDQIYHVEDRFKMRMYQLKKSYDEKMLQLVHVASDLHSAQRSNLSDDAKFVPVGGNAMYARSYETYGTPSGSGVPLMAEPQSLNGPSYNRK